jgi:alpha-beta hydrolase superfamily lysophospholipase
MNQSNNQFVENGLYYRHWPLEDGQQLKAVVMLIHGLGEHCERYTAIAKALNSAGYALCSMDLPGHGQSEGVPGHIDHFSDYSNAALSLHAKVLEWYPDQPIYLLGHSMGGLIATHLLVYHQKLFSGALLSGAAIQSPQEPPAWQLNIMKGLSAIAPKMGALTLDASCISHDSDVVEKYMNDPLVNKGKLSARLLVEMFGAMGECTSRAAEIDLPILIMHGGGDVMTAPEGSKLLFDTVSSKDKALKIYDGLYHEIFNEPEQEDIYAEVIAWLDQRQ